ncbi:MAG: NUDIX hydrolase [Clostridia bacterium]|nr:NUDIX hydrolase [Clostridia bacterium]
MRQCGKEHIISSSRIFSGRIVQLDHAEVRLPEGGTAMREIVHHALGACCVAVAPDGRIYTVEQYRIPMDDFTIELPAGKVDEGEDPIDAVKREMSEEIGMTAANLELICSAAVSPGFTDEVVYIYMATDLTACQMEPDQDEYLTVRLYTLDQLMNMISEGRIYDAKTILGLYYASLHKDRYGIT